MTLRNIGLLMLWLIVTASAHRLTQQQPQQSQQSQQPQQLEQQQLPQSTTQSEQSDNKQDQSSEADAATDTETDTIDALDASDSADADTQTDTDQIELELAEQEYGSQYEYEGDGNGDGLIDVGYDQYLSMFGKRELSGEGLHEYRSYVYGRNLEIINKHNQKNSTYRMGLNQFTDLQKKQFSKLYLNLRVLNKFLPRSKVNSSQLSPADQQPDQSESIDWTCRTTELDALSDVDHLNVCGAGYVRASLDAIEITYRIHRIKVRSLSVQEVVSCGGNKLGIFGCFGGFYKGVFKYVKKNGVLPAKIYKQQPYKKSSKSTPKCLTNLTTNSQLTPKKTFIKGSKLIPQGDCTQILNKLRSRALTISIAGSPLQHYQSGLLDLPDNRREELNHAVTLIGYSPENGWKVRNSWGTGWGMGGYAYVTKRLGVCQMAVYPILAKERAVPRRCSGEEYGSEREV